MSKIIVTGGCGYIGSHTVVDLLDNGYEPIILDSNVRSDPAVVDAIEHITGKAVSFEQVDICQLDALRVVFEKHKDAKGIIHFAAFKSVPESMKDPLRYYQNNNVGLLNVLTCQKEWGIQHFVFSSSCSVYGNTTDLPVTEQTLIGEAQSPYAHTKQLGEQMIMRIAQAQPEQQYILLRYFNPGGAHPSGHLGEVPQEGAYNVIPILMEALEGKRPQFIVTGGDYSTPDGSCIRDYIHVMDVAHAHIKALQYLLGKRQCINCEIFNIGLGKGVSVLELIKAFNKATGQELSYRIGPRRSGDVAAIYADASKANQQLGWFPKYSVDDLLATGWVWHSGDYKCKWQQ